MPLIHYWTASGAAHVAVWKIAEEAAYFQAAVDGPAVPPGLAAGRRLQWLAGRYLLHYLRPGFPVGAIRLGAGGKPEAPGAPCFSISHSGPYVAAAVCATSVVGLDIQRPDARAAMLRSKFLSAEEESFFPPTERDALVAFAAKEAAYKWQGLREVNWKAHMPITAAARAGDRWRVEIHMRRCHPSVPLVVEGWDWPAFTLALAVG